jgi:sister chromatid cohesion protein PDS5
MLVDEANPESTWLPDDAVPSLLQAKIIALKICRRRCLVYAKDKQNDEASKEATLLVAKPVLSMLATILETAGSANTKAEDR